MSTANNSFDPRQAIEGLFGYVKDMAMSSLNRRAKPEPNEDRLEVAILSSLESGPRTASQISSAIKLAAGGTWTPTDGQIHKGLSKLTDAGLTSVKSKSDRKIYSITKAGEEALESARVNASESPSEPAFAVPGSMNWLNCEANFMKSASKLPPVMLDIAQTATRVQQAKAAEILDKARHDLHKVLAEK